MIQYSYTDVIDDDSVFTYWCYKKKTQKMIQYSHTDETKDNSEDDRRCSSMYEKWFSIYIPKIAKDDPAEINDEDECDVPKLPMTYRDSPVSCTVVVAVVVVVEYLPS